MTREIFVFSYLLTNVAHGHQKDGKDGARKDEYDGRKSVRAKREEKLV